MSARAKAPTDTPRPMTANDWKALYVVHQLATAIVLHGEQALHEFVAAAHEASR